MEGLHLVDPQRRETTTNVRNVDPQEGSSGGAGFQVESRRPLRGVIGRVLEAKARASHQLESRLSESPESWTGDADRARSESVRWGLSGQRKCRLRPNVVFGDHGSPSIYWWQWDSKASLNRHNLCGTRDV